MSEGGGGRGSFGGGFSGGEGSVSRGFGSESASTGYGPRGDVSRENYPGNQSAIKDEEISDTERDNRRREYKKYSDQVKSNNHSISDCFIATAVYQGDGNHPNVERLRQFRDNFLTMSHFGWKFIRFYYGGFGFKASAFMKRYFPWTLFVLRKIFDLIIPFLPVNLLKEEKEVSQEVLRMDYRKLSIACSDFLRKELEKRKLNCFCVGLSGGVDSAVTAALCKLTGKDVVAITISAQWIIREQDVEDAKIVANQLGIRHIVVDLTELFTRALEFELPNSAHIIMGIRNAVIKEIAEDCGGLLVGTEVKTEFCAGLFSPNSLIGTIFPLENIYKTQCYALAKHLGLPECVLHKPSHSGIDGDGDDSFWGIGCSLFDWVLCLLEKEYSIECIEIETGVMAHVVRAIKERKEMSEIIMSFPSFKFEPMS